MFQIQSFGCVLKNVVINIKSTIIFFKTRFAKFEFGFSYLIVSFKQNVKLQFSKLFFQKSPSLRRVRGVFKTIPLQIDDFVTHRFIAVGNVDVSTDERESIPLYVIYIITSNLL